MILTLSNTQKQISVVEMLEIFWSSILSDAKRNIFKWLIVVGFWQICEDDWLFVSFNKWRQLSVISLVLLVLFGFYIFLCHHITIFLWFWTLKCEKHVRLIYQATAAHPKCCCQSSAGVVVSPWLLLCCLKAAMHAAQQKAFPLSLLRFPFGLVCMVGFC